MSTPLEKWCWLEVHELSTEDDGEPHLLGDAAAPSIIGYIADKRTLLFALTTTAPTFLFLAGLVCLIGMRNVARDMQHVQEQMRGEDGD